MIFTAGAPGSGKTYTLHHLFGLDNVNMLDLDTVMPHHPEFDAAHKEKLYTRKDAYDWANEQVELRFKQLCNYPFYADGRGKVVCFDGTGTHVARQKRRMWDAKHAGFWVIQLYVHVTLDTCIDRNQKRDRTVPEDILRGYVEKLDAAVTELRNEPGLVDEFIAVSLYTGRRPSWQKHT